MGNHLTRSDGPAVPVALTTALLTPARRHLLVCGPGGGGEALAGAILDTYAADQVSTRHGSTACGGSPADVYTWAGGQILDLAIGAGLGPRPKVTPVPRPPQPAGADVLLIRDRTQVEDLDGDVVIDLTEPGATGDGLFRSLLATHCGLDRATTAALAVRFAPATALVPELRTRHRRGSPHLPSATASACYELPMMRALMHDVVARGGTRVHELGRALCLVQRQEFDCGDEWARLASALTGRSYCAADIDICLRDFPGLFSLRRSGGHTTVALTSPFAATLILASQINCVRVTDHDDEVNAFTFQHGVASGTVTESSAVLWTRVAPTPHAPRPQQVGWTVTSQDGTLVRLGMVEVSAETDHAVQVQVDDLPADHPYQYSFQLGWQVSPTGRFRTLPTNASAPPRWAAGAQ